MSKANSERDKAVTPNEFLEQVRPLLDSAVRNACRHCHHLASAEDVERLKQRLCLHLLKKAEDDMDGLQELSSQRAWLQKVTNNYVSRFLQQERRNLRLEDAPADRFTLQPTQEKELLKKEWVAILAKAMPKLTSRQQKLFELIVQGLSAKEIARRMKMAEASVYQRKRALIDKLRQLIGADGNK
jgi:RNA polymerase sigma factor (sigma-70 family)